MIFIFLFNCNFSLKNVGIAASGLKGNRRIFWSDTAAFTVDQRCRSLQRNEKSQQSQKSPLNRAQNARAAKTQSKEYMDPKEWQKMKDRAAE